MGIKFSKEYLISEKGEVVKIAGIVTQDTKIIAALENQRRIYGGGEDPKNSKQTKQKEEKSRCHFFSLLSVPNYASNSSKKNRKSEYTVLVFHCLDTKEQDVLTNHT